MRQNILVCTPQPTSAEERPATQNGGYLKSSVDNAW